MTIKKTLLASLAIISLILIINIASASTSFSDYPNYEGDWYRSDDYRYSSPVYNAYAQQSSSYSSSSFTQFPDWNSNKLDAYSSSSSNYDSSDYNYDYRGPLYEKTTKFNDDLLIDKSTDDDFFTTDTTDILHRSITMTTSEKYIGATESLYTNNQNRRTSNTNSISNENTDYDGGLSWSSVRLFDNSEYSEDIGYNNYYYRPLFDSSNGYYVWDY